MSETYTRSTFLYQQLLELYTVLKWFGLQRGDHPLVISHAWFLLRRFILTCIALALIVAIVALLCFPYLLAISGTIVVIIVIVYLDTARYIRSNLNTNTARRHMLTMMLSELFRMRLSFEQGRWVIYEDKNGKVGFVNEILSYDWCDRLSELSGASVAVFLPQMRIHDIVSLAKDHNHYRQKLEDMIVPNRMNGMLSDEEARRVRSYCELLQVREDELVRVVLEVTNKGQDLINTININSCESPDSISP